MFDSEFKGYYIHVRAPYGQSEVSSSDLINSLEFEIRGQAQTRGLTIEDPTLQTFEIFMPPLMLENYKDLYYKNISNEISNAMNNKTNRFNAVQ